MSRVFLAQERALGRPVVVKVLPPEMAAGVNAERFRRESQLAASLQHPHLVPLLAAGGANDLVYYTMPLIDGESLRAKLAREGELPIRETVRLLRDVTDALAYAHAHGVVHRDIKPDNVLVANHHAVVTDFGVAKALGESPGRGITPTGTEPAAAVTTVSRWLKAALGTAGLVVVATVTLLLARPRSAVLTLGQVKQLTSEPGLEIEPAISPDGKFVAYAAGPLSTTRIYLRQPGGRPVALTADSGPPQRRPV